MVKIIEDSVQLQGCTLYTKTWLPDGPPKAILIFVHGFSDHINAYHGFFPALAERGIACYGHDRRGWGRSVKTPADRGRMGPTSQVMDDLAAFITHVLDQNRANGYGDVPAFVLGHSMGGIDVATFMSAAPGDPRASVLPQVYGWLFESPFFGFTPAEEPSALKVISGRLAGWLFPNMQLKHVVPAELLTRDPAAVEEIRNDTLCHDMGTLESLAGMLDRVNALANGGCVPHAAVTRVWIGHGTGDGICSYDAVKKWYKSRATDGLNLKTMRTYHGAFHQLHSEIEPDRAAFYRDVGDWILARVNEASKESNAAVEEAVVLAQTEAAEAAAEAKPAAAQEADKGEAKL